MDKKRVEVIAAWPEPTTFREIQSFLGFCNFYRRFIEGYSKIVAPMTALLKGSHNGKKAGKVELNGTERAAFERPNQAFHEAPLLHHFDPQLPIRIETDASNVAMADILSQPDARGRWHPVAFWSRKFTAAERNYGTPDQEMFAIVMSFKQWLHYVEGVANPVEVLSNHQNLQAFMRQTKLSGRQARWCMYLAPYDFVIKHRSGKLNLADAPSRRLDYAGQPQANQELMDHLRKRLVRVPEVDCVLMRQRRDEMSLWGTT